MRRCLTAALMIVTAAPALAARWTPVVDTTDRAVYLDSAALAREGNQVRAWVREVYTREQRSEQAGVNFYSANALVAYDCSARTSAPLFKVFFGVDGMELRRVSLDAAEVPALAVPGSLPEQLLDRACALSAKPPKQAKPAVARAGEGEDKSADGAKAGDKAHGAADKAAAAKVETAKADTAKADAAKPAQKPGEDKHAGAQDASDKHGGDKAGANPQGGDKVAADKHGADKGTADKHGADKSTPHAGAGKQDADKIALPLPPQVKPGRSPVPGRTTAARDPHVIPAAVRTVPERVPLSSPIRQAESGGHGYVVPSRVSVRRATKPAAEKPKDEHGGQHDIHWSYGGEGGPENWGRLKDEYQMCTKGTRQSPIDIKEGARLELEPIRFDYKPSPLRIVDNGHTVQVNYTEGSSITVAGERYDLKQFHFHKPAEERIDGRSFALVAHLVHQSVEGRLAVVAVLFDMREQENGFLRSLWPHLPLEPKREVFNSTVMLDVNDLLPETRTYFTYMGSLTTPPCSEGVRWLVLKTPVEISPKQVAVFGRLYMVNARPIQPSNGRLIKESM